MLVVLSVYLLCMCLYVFTLQVHVAAEACQPAGGYGWTLMQLFLGLFLPLLLAGL
jgi:hypothetical protein